MVGVVVVDDQAPFRRAARAVVGATPGFELIAEAVSGEEAVALARSLEPDVVLMDIKMPGIGGIEATRRITAASAGTVVVLVSSYGGATFRRTPAPAARRPTSTRRASGTRRPGGSLEQARSRLAPLLGQEEQHRLDAPVHVRLPGETELLEDRVDVLLDRSLGDDERRGYRGVVLPRSPSRPEPRARGGVSASSGESSRRDPAATSDSTTFGSIAEPPAATSRIAPTSCSRSLTRSFRR